MAFWTSFESLENSCDNTYKEQKDDLHNITDPEELNPILDELEDHINVNAQNSLGHTPAMSFAIRKDVQLVELVPDVEFVTIDKQKVAEIILEEMECPICMIEMTPPKKIYSCSNAHLFCQNCKIIPALTNCPSCREDFRVTPPLNSKLAERWARKIFQM
jgi:hypothetical protein